MQILLVDTQPHVVQWLTGFLPFVTGFALVNPMQITHVSKVATAIRTVGDKDFDLLFLRHDLQQEPKNGANVRDFLIKNPEINPAMQIICHGVNVVNDPWNAAELAKHGRLARWYPIGLEPGWRFAGRL